jgi:hypothetical protein
MSDIIRLFNPETEAYTELGSEYARKVDEALKIIIEDASTKSISLRDLETVIYHSASLQTCAATVKRRKNL